MGRVRINPLHLRVDSRPVVECPLCSEKVKYGPVVPFMDQRLASHIGTKCPAAAPGLDHDDALRLVRELLNEEAE